MKTTEMARAKKEGQKRRNRKNLVKNEKRIQNNIKVLKSLQKSQE